eukprot:365077-Chlamydomonas_euryale.AAC.14
MSSCARTANTAACRLPVLSATHVLHGGVPAQKASTMHHGRPPLVWLVDCSSPDKQLPTGLWLVVECGQHVASRCASRSSYRAGH